MGKTKNNYISSDTNNSTTSSVLVIDKSKPDNVVTKKSNWYTFTFSFLSLSEIGCNDFLINKSPDKNLVLSILFNLKHSLEIVIKTISNDISGEFTEGHDVQDLIGKLKAKVGKNKNKIKLNTQLNKFESYLEKYCKLEFLNDTFKSAIILNDKNNILFKYPESNGKVFIHIDYSNLVNKITKSDIKSIKKDITEIRLILNELKGVIKD